MNTANGSPSPILHALIRRILADKNAQPAIIDRHDKRATNLDGDRPAMREEDARPLVEAGLLQRNTDGMVCFKLTPEGVRQGLAQVDYTPLDLEAVIRAVLDTVLFGPSDAIDGDTAIPASYAPGEGRLVLVLGENAGGKSMFRRLLRQMTHPGRKESMGEQRIPRGDFPVREFIGLSMEMRTTSGFASTAVYGTEDWQSTGENSARSVTGAITTARGRDHRTVLYWDEPDIGMSAGAAVGAGIAIADFVRSIPTESPLIQAVCVTTHSTALLRPLADLNPHYLYLGDGDGPKTLAQWFERQANPVPVMPEDLRQRSQDRFKKIRAILNAR